MGSVGQLQLGGFSLLAEGSRLIQGDGSECHLYRRLKEE